MNRYTAIGIAAEAAKGDRIIVLTRRRADVIDALTQIAVAWSEWSSMQRVRRTNGDERIEHPGGGWVRVTPRSAARGLSADAVYVDGFRDELTADGIASLWAVVATSPAGRVVFSD